jgi:hypothetical protein
MDGSLFLLSNPRVSSTTATAHKFDPKEGNCLTNNHSENPGRDSSKDTKDDWTDDGTNKTADAENETLMLGLMMIMVRSMMWTRLSVLRTPVVMTSSKLVMTALDPSNWLAILCVLSSFLGLLDGFLNLSDDHGPHAAERVVAVHADSARRAWSINWEGLDNHDGNIGVGVMGEFDLEGVNVDLTAGEIEDGELEVEPVLAVMGFMWGGLEGITHRDRDGLFRERRRSGCAGLLSVEGMKVGEFHREEETVVEKDPVASKSEIQTLHKFASDLSDCRVIIKRTKVLSTAS